MIPADKTRPSLNKGKYLFYSPVFRSGFSFLDFLLKLVSTFHGAAPSLGGLRPERVLLCMQAHIGDAILATGAIDVIGLAFPATEIGVLTHPDSSAVFSGNLRVARVHTFEHFMLNRSAAGLPAKLVRHARSRSHAIEEIRQNRYDIAIDMYPFFPNSIPLLARCRIPVRIGWTSGGCGGLLTHGVDWQQGPETSAVEWHKRLLSQLPGCVAHVNELRPILHVAEHARNEWSSIRAKRTINGEFMAFHIGAGSERRRWPDDQWVALARRCAENGFKVVVFGHGVDDERLGGRVAAEVDGVESLCGQLTWQAMVAGIADARLLVGNDSSPVHIAAAVGTPLICIAPGIYDGAFDPVSRRAVIIKYPVPCSGCHLNGGCEGMECIRNTTADTVFVAVTRMLGG